MLTSADQPPSPEPTPPDLVGRQAERTALRAHLAAARDGRGHLVLIGGEAVIGKTALAEALCREAAEQGAFVLVGRCYDLIETPPYGPWLDLFARYRVSPDLPPPPTAFARRDRVGDVASQEALFLQREDFFADLAKQRPVVLLLDDIHWADTASLDLLRYLARSLATRSVLIVTTHRAEELNRHQPLYRLLPALVRESSASRLDLRRLHSADIETLITQRYRLPPGDITRLVRHLHERAEGNPLFTGELLRALWGGRGGG